MLLSEKADAQIQAIGCQKQQNDQASTAKHRNRLERVDAKPSSGCAGKKACDGGQTGIWGKTSFGRHCDRPFEVDGQRNA
jgi:hypothetical protein